jgi:hypothetical protein
MMLYDGELLRHRWYCMRLDDLTTSEIGDTCVHYIARVKVVYGLSGPQYRVIALVRPFGLFVD